MPHVLDTPDCPDCEASFDSFAKLRYHFSNTHGGSLPNRECGNCGVWFYSEDVQTYCSVDCYRDDVSYEGKDNPAYTGSLEKTKCKLCGATFEYYPSEKRGLYCSDCVENKDWRDVPEPPTGEDNHFWTGGKRTVECDSCGAELERWPNTISEHNFCNRDCQYTWLSEAFTGEGHPNWADGGNRNYGPGWRRTKLETLERDGYRCVLCGTSRDDLGRNPDVHHIIPVRLFDESPDHDLVDAHFPENLIALCVTCHRRADHGRLPPRILWGAIDVDISLADDRFPDAAVDEVLRAEFAAAD